MSDPTRQHDTIAVLDFGGQYAHLIGTKVRRMGVHSIITDPDAPTETYKDVKGIILSGSPALASKGEEQGYNREIYDLDVPILGFCFGHQEIVGHYGGKVEHSAREFGPADLHLTGKSPLMTGLDPVETVFMSHGDSVTEVPEGFIELGYSKLGDDGIPHAYAAVADETRKRYGFQFHPEVDDTVHGERMIANFIREICGCEPSWSMDAFLADKSAELAEQIGDRDVFLLASGGVDSTVCAFILAKVVGPERLHLLHIDNGFMRLDESAQVMEAFRENNVSHNLHFADAGEAFLGALGDAIEPEKKRLSIGNTFIDVFRAESEKLGLDPERLVLAQGTIYPDTVETGGTKRSDTIKTHHNRVPIIEELIAKGQVVEPLAELYKVEVRELGRRLAVPDAMIDRHPFPGPGLGVRCLGSTGQAPADYDAAAVEAAAGPLAAPFGFGVRALPIQSVGVKADLRCYELPVMLCPEGDGKDWTSDSAELAAGSIYKLVAGVNRCVVALAPHAPKVATPLAATMTRKRLDILRLADDAVMRGLARHDQMGTVWQCPTVLVPLSLDGADGELVVVRPVLSERAMTARIAPLPPALLEELREEIMAIEGVGGLALDVTSKPPGTIEWE